MSAAIQGWLTCYCGGMEIDLVGDHYVCTKCRKTRGEFMVPKPEPRMIKVMEDINQMTVQEVVDFCLQRDLDLETTRITGGHMQWSRPQTEKEAARTAAWEAESAKRKDTWEKETYIRLREKFGEPS